MKSEEFATAKMNEHYTLHQLNLLVREAIEDTLPDEYWVEAELSEFREPACSAGVGCNVHSSWR